MCAMVTMGCEHPVLMPDKPQLSPQVRLIDSTMHSVALARDMHLRIIVPVIVTKEEMLPVVYLLHGAGTDYRDWTNNSQIASFAAKGFVLVLPDEAGAYYINEASGSNRRYEDYFVNEVIPEIHRIVPYASRNRADNAIVGISRGGYGAVVLALKHPDLFSFVGDLSGAVDFPERHFRWRAPWASLGNRKVFGPVGSPENRSNDPFALLHTISPSQAPYFFVSSGDKDSLLDPNRRFATALANLGFPSEFHLLPGGHNWSVWGADIPLLEASLLKKLRPCGSLPK